MNKNEETRLRNLLSKEKDGMPMTKLDRLYLKKLTAKKRNEEMQPEGLRPVNARNQIGANGPHPQSRHALKQKAADIPNRTPAASGDAVQSKLPRRAY